MKFETKFNLGDTIWFMRNNVPTKAIVTYIQASQCGTNKTVFYNAKRVTGSVSWLDYTNLNEINLFESKKDLLMALLGIIVCKGKNCTSTDGLGHSIECQSEHELC